MNVYLDYLNQKDEKKLNYRRYSADKIIVFLNTQSVQFHCSEMWHTKKIKSTAALEQIHIFIYSFIGFNRYKYASRKLLMWLEFIQ